MPPILKINSHYVRSLTIETIDDYNKEQKQSGNFSIGFELFPHETSDRLFQLQIAVRVHANEPPPGKPINYPYACAIAIAGMFEAPAALLNDKGEVDATLAANGLGILYGIARGVVTTFTGAFYHGPFLLPTIDPLQTVLNILAQQERESQTRPAEDEVVPGEASSDVPSPLE